MKIKRLFSGMLGFSIFAAVIGGGMLMTISDSQAESVSALDYPQIKALPAATVTSASWLLQQTGPYSFTKVNADSLTRYVQAHTDSSSSGAVLATLTGVTTTVTDSVRWSKVFKNVVLIIPVLTGTSNTTAATITMTLPQRVKPLQSVPVFFQSVTDSGNVTMGSGVMDTSGTITISHVNHATGLLTATCNNAAAKAVGVGMASYPTR